MTIESKPVCFFFGLCYAAPQSWADIATIFSAAISLFALSIAIYAAFVAYKQLTYAVNVSSAQLMISASQQLQNAMVEYVSSKFDDIESKNSTKNISGGQQNRIKLQNLLNAFELYSMYLLNGIIRDPYKIQIKRQIIDLYNVFCINERMTFHEFKIANDDYEFLEKLLKSEEKEAQERRRFFEPK